MGEASPPPSCTFEQMFAMLAAQPLALSLRPRRPRPGPACEWVGVRGDDASAPPDGGPPRGLPRGRLAVLPGERGRATGRLTLLQALAARASRSMEVAYVDLAGTLDPGFLADLGADLGACYVVRPPGRALGPGL